MMFSLSLLLLIAPAVHAVNDWNVPCFNGVCEYSLPSSNNSASGSLRIWGSADAISDITTAAGWEILGCSPDAKAQDIRLVCKSDNSSSGCSHLYQNGAVGKVVRLPQNCGASAFARVADAYVPQDQSIPSSVARRVVRRDGSTPEVKGLKLDTNFGAIDSSKSGVINIAIMGANVPGVPDGIDLPTINSRIVQPPKSAAKTAAKTVKQAGSAVVDDAKKVESKAAAAESVNDIDLSKTVTLPPIDVSKKVSLLDKSISCGPVTASVTADVDAKAHAIVALGVAASGTLVPPKLDDFSITATVTADLDSSLTMVADIAGTLDSGAIKIFEVGIPGLDFPGILSIGPTFTVSAQAKAALDLNVNLDVGLNYKIEQAQLVFPPNGEKGGSFNFDDTPLKLSVSPNVKATGSVEAHLIPSLNLGISALDDVAKATVFLNLDASATMELTLDAKLPGVEASVGRRSIEERAAASLVPTSSEKAVASTGTTANSDSSVKVATTSAQFGGCFDVKAGLSVNAGADASFFDIFNTGTKVTLFQKDFELFKACGLGINI
ncbi:hypothetical protein C8J56DRAFT_788976 [Mycena floridula]|nr:hypothetical protein C8J56DRAFT_788976 [Mycena floridula]